MKVSLMKVVMMFIVNLIPVALVVDDDDGDNIDQACYLPPEFDQLNISCDKDFLDHENDGIDSTLVQLKD